MGRKSRAKREAQGKSEVVGAMRYEGKAEPITREDLRVLMPNLAKSEPDAKIRIESRSDLPPVSDQLTDFGEPIYERLQPDSAAEMKHCYTLVSMLWNSFRVAPGKPLDQLNDLIDRGIRAMYGERFYRQMIERNKPFENDPRIVLEVNVLDKGNNEYRLMVASMTPSDESEGGSEG